MGLAPEKVLLKWMNFHLKKAGYKKTVTNYSSDLKVEPTVTNFSVRTLESLQFLCLCLVCRTVKLMLICLMFLHQNMVVQPHWMQKIHRKELNWYLIMLREWIVKDT